MASQFGTKIKELRAKKGIFQRQLAAMLDMDSPLFSKIERGERTAKKEMVLKLANILNVDKDFLLSIWLADQVFEMVKDEEVAINALNISKNEIKKNREQ
jgi:transcriptional regulator with XRE-family HTH domain